MWLARLFSGRRLGWFRDQPDSRDYDFDRLNLNGGVSKEQRLKSNRARASLESFVPAVMNQGRTSSCVAQALAAAVAIREEIHNLHSGFPSRLFIYYYARIFHDGHRRDDGTYIRTACKGLQMYGAPQEKFWPFRSRLINKQPKWVASNHAHPRRNGVYYKIKSSDRTSRIMAAIDNGYPIVFGMRVDNAFLKSRGPHIIDTPQGKQVGGHAMVIIGYEQDGEKILFRILNSWGTKWRDGGFAWLTQSCVNWDGLNDLTVIAGWDRIKKEATL